MKGTFTAFLFGIWSCFLTIHGPFSFQRHWDFAAFHAFSFLLFFSSFQGALETAFLLEVGLKMLENWQWEAAEYYPSMGDSPPIPPPWGHGCLRLEILNKCGGPLRHYLSSWALFSGEPSIKWVPPWMGQHGFVPFPSFFLKFFKWGQMVPTPFGSRTVKEEGVKDQSGGTKIINGFSHGPPLTFSQHG